MRICIIGANGATGKQLVRQAVGRGMDVVALDRGRGDDSHVGEQVDFREADVLTDDLSNHFRGCNAIVSAIGVGNNPRTLLNPPPLYTDGVANIIRDMRRADVKRLIVISATFVAATDRGPLYFRLPAMLALRKIFDEMAFMERILEREKHIEWTAVRPGWLMDGDLTSDYTITPNMIREDLIRTRHADLAHFMLDCAETGMWVKQTPAVARAEQPEATAFSEVMKELVA